MTVRRLLCLAPALALALCILRPVAAQEDPCPAIADEITCNETAGCSWDEFSLSCSLTATPTPTLTATPTPTATPTSTPPPSLNHFQCYDVRRQSFDRLTLSLDDDFGPSMVEVRRPKLLCAPVNKNDEDPTAPDDPDHLVGYEIRRTTVRFEGVRDEIVEDQFGTLLLDLRRPERLLVPSAKSVTDPATPLDPPVVDHYQCYKVRGDRRRVPDVKVQDQFGTDMTDVKKPLRLCVPVDKNGEEILDNAARLMCYRIKPGPRVNTTVFVDNQFGPGSLNVRRARELCVPVATPTCCDPLAEPGQLGNALCFEGYACCPNTGEWACSIGDGVTFSCGGELTTGPFGSACPLP